MTPSDPCCLISTPCSPLPSSIEPGLLCVTRRVGRSDSMALLRLGHKRAVASVLGTLLHALSLSLCLGSLALG